MQAGGARGGVEAEKDAHRGRDEEGEQDGLRRDDRLQALGAAGDRELVLDVAAARPDRLANPDLTGPLGHRDQHDVHDPDPADQERDAGHRAEQDRESLSHLGEGGQEVLLALNREVVLGRPVPLSEHLRNLVDHLLRDSLLSHLDVDNRDVRPATRVALGDESGLHRGDRDEHLVILVAEAGPTLGLHHTDHAVIGRDTVVEADPNCLADGIVIAEQIRRDVAAKHDYARVSFELRPADELAIGDVRVADRLVAGSGAGDSSRGILAVSQQLAEAGLLRRGGDNRGDPLRKRLGVLERKRDGAALGRADPGLLSAAGADEKQIGPEALDLRGDLLLRALADRHHRDHGADADDDAQHRQTRSELVGAERPKRDPDRLEDAHVGVATSEWRSASGEASLVTRHSSLVIRPSRMWMIRRVWAATSGSCVTKMTVMPRSPLRRSKIAMISALEWESRLPVGSSAMMILGSAASARAIAARCCWPPESSVGLWLARSDRPTAASASRERWRRSFSPAYMSGSSTCSTAVILGSRLKL